MNAPWESSSTGLTGRALPSRTARTASWARTAPSAPSDPDLRVAAATNQPLDAEAAAVRFRWDLQNGEDFGIEMPTAGPAADRFSYDLL